MSHQRVAIVYDWIDKWGGVERLLLTLHEMYPNAHWYTSYYDSQKALWAKDLHITTSFIQKLPSFIKKNRILSIPFYPYAFESFDLKNYDLVISVTSSFAKGVITRPEAKHICYLLTPTRYIWGLSEQYIYGWKQIFSTKAIEELRKWDFIAAQRPDTIISLSSSVAERCKKYYQRQSVVIFPPFDTDYWENIKLSIKNYELSKSKLYGILKPVQEASSNYYLIVSRLEPYKKIDLAIDTFNNLPNKQLIIVGEGTQQKKLHQIANNNIIFIENITDVELAYLYSHARALIMPQEEDFGYTSLEAQFYSCPVIAYRKGGAAETVIDNLTGIMFSEQNRKSLQAALERFEQVEYNLRDINTHLRKFSKNNFKKELRKVINN